MLSTLSFQMPSSDYYADIRAEYQLYLERMQHVETNQPSSPKPRLSKEEVDMLEKEFGKNPKPNNSTKRVLAEHFGVEVPRINVRFLSSPARYSGSRH